MRRELKLNSFRDLEKEIEKIEKAVGPKTTGVWSVYQILQHLTDMLHGSMHGFPKHQPKIVRMTVGKYMYKKIIKSGVMRAGYSNSSAPGKREDAPILPAIQRLKAMITEFENYNGHMAMHPFFDRLNKEEWTKLHLIHFALHLSFITDLENPLVEETISQQQESIDKKQESENSLENVTPMIAGNQEVQSQSEEEQEEEIEEVLEVREEVELEVVTPVAEVSPENFERDFSDEPVETEKPTISKKSVSKKKEPVAKKKELATKKQETVAKKKEPLAKKKSEPVSKKKQPISKKKTTPPAPPAKKKPATKKK